MEIENMLQRFSSLLFKPHLMFTSHGILHCLWSVDLKKSFSQLILSILIFSQYFFQQLLLIFIFINIFFNRFCLVEKFGVTSHRLFRDSNIMIKGSQYKNIKQHYIKGYCLSGLLSSVKQYNLTKATSSNSLFIYWILNTFWFVVYILK